MFIRIRRFPPSSSSYADYDRKKPAAIRKFN